MKENKNEKENNNEIFRQLGDNLKPALAQLDSVSDLIRPSLQTIKETSTLLFQAISSTWNPIRDSISEIVRNLQASLQELFVESPFPEVSEKRKEYLIQSHRRWGEYGWTINPVSLKDTLFDTIPSDQKNADKQALKECSEESLRSLFQICLDMKHVKKKDYLEAIDDFNNRRYKSCVLLLFSLIDAIMIRLQKKSELNGQRRSVGRNAIRNAKERALRNCNDSMLFSLLFFENLFSCLLQFFKDGEDFKVQPNVINRNFLDHGMMTRRVSRKDCIQVFLLYFNVLEMLEMIYSK